MGRAHRNLRRGVGRILYRLDDQFKFNLRAIFPARQPIDRIRSASAQAVGEAMRLGLFCSAAVVAAMLAVSARAESPWYVSGSLGGYFREGASGPDTFFKIDDPSISSPGTQRESFDPGYIANAAVGYRLLANVRVEAELGYADYMLSTVSPQADTFPQLNGQPFNRQTGGEWSRFTGTINAFYDLPVPGRFVPYVGLGVGGAHGEATTARLVSSTGAIFESLGGSSTRGVMLAEGGVSIALSEHISLVPAYRYLRYFLNASVGGDEAAHIVKLGLRYSF
jgi:opacity protein-like surface antigen